MELCCIVGFEVGWCRLLGLELVMLEFLENILYYVGFVAIGGTLAPAFFLMFAPNIVGTM